MRRVFKIKFLIFLFFFATIIPATAQTGINAGFVNGMWYSKMPFFAEDTVRIYAVIQNQSGFDITGAIQFFDNNKLLSESDFSAVNGRLIEKWADWNVSSGEHIIRVQITDVKKMEIGKAPVAVELNANIIITEKHLIDIDSDKDGIGNQEDLDDDDDGVSDLDEIKAGSNPLVFNPPVQPIVEKVAEQSKETVGATDTKIETAKIVLADTARITTEVAENVLGVSQNLAGKAKVFLQDKKEEIDKELEQEKKEAEIKETLFGTKETTEEIDVQNSLLASVLGNLPALKELYSFFLAVLIYILDSWWLLIGLLCFLLWSIWRIFKRRLNLRQF